MKEDRISVSVVEWHLQGQSGVLHPEFQVQDGVPTLLPFTQDGRIYTGKLAVPSSGTLVMEFSSPRPLRVWFGNVLVVDECLYRYSFQREVKGAALYSCNAGMLEFTVEAGLRPHHLDFVDAACPSRNRESVMKRIAGQFPDKLELEAWVQEGVNCPAASLRWLPTQFSQNGTVFQHMLVRQADMSLNEPPSIDLWSTADRVQPVLAVSMADGTALSHGASLQEQKASLQRFYIPVGNVDNPAVPLRTAQSDDRVEPRLEPVRNVSICVSSVQLNMPVYESLGRNAPVKEFDPTCWPDYDDAKTKLPKPILPENLVHFGDLYDEAWRMLFRLVRQPVKESGIRQPFISTGTNFTHSQFVWDTSFTTMATAYGSHAIPLYATINLLYAAQQDGGYIHRETDTRDGMPILYEPDFSPNPPIISVAEWAMAGVTGDKERLKTVYPLLVDYHNWLRYNRRLADGTYWTTGLANGLDNSPSLGDGYPCLTAQMAHDSETLGKMAALLGLDEDVIIWNHEYAETVKALNEQLWDTTISFYATSLPGGGHNPNKVVTGFWPLWAGAVPEDRVASLARHLKDPSSFWREHPIPSLAADSPHFVPGGQYWLGSTWAPTNYAAIKGFERSGRHDLALETTLRHLDFMWKVQKETGYIWENYCSEEPKRGSWSMHDYCWSALGPIALLIEIVLGIQADALNDKIIWNLPAESKIGIRDFPLGNGVVSLQKIEQEGKSVIEVESDRVFTLQVLERDKNRIYRISPGISVIS